MPRTLSVSGSPPDLDGTIVDGIESLRQRVTQAIRFRRGEWFLDTRRGIPESDLIGHQTAAGIAAGAVTSAIRTEGGDEVTAIEDIRFSIVGRRFRYQARIQTIYGPMEVQETV